MTAASSSSHAIPRAITIFFFFSSGRRHTRSKRDWSSDVCSSDLSVISEKDVDIYEQFGINKESIELISDEFLDAMKKEPEKDLAIVVLENVLKGKVKAMLKVNQTASKQFTEMLKKSIDDYNNRGITSELVIRQLIEIAKKIREQQNKGEDLGLTQEEVAFYDALADHKKAVEMLGEETLQLIAKELVKVVQREAGIDWEKRESVQAKMRREVRRLLRKYGYPPDFQKQAVETVIEQAELMASNNS